MKMVLRSKSANQTIVRAQSNHRPILKKYSADTYKPLKEDASDNIVNFRSASASPTKPQHRPASCQETAWGVTESKSSNDNYHWLSWNTGDLEPPGIQTRLVKPYPSPVPPSNYGGKGFISSKLTRQPTQRNPTPVPQASPALRASSVASISAPCFIKNTKAATATQKYDTGSHPYFRSWQTSGCNAYEADVTYNMLQHLYGGKARQLDTMRRNRPGQYEHPINFERRIINDTYKGLERMDHSTSRSAGPSMQRAPMDYYPVSYHAPRSGIGKTDHTASSFFQYTQPSVKGSFVIHPQFVSEHCEFSKKLKSTKNLSHLTAAKGSSSFRYGSARTSV